jgi:hypothetical protein
MVNRYFPPALRREHFAGRGAVFAVPASTANSTIHMNFLKF